MNRRNFLVSLALAAASAPVLAKVIAEAKPVQAAERFDCTDVDFESNMDESMHDKLLRHIAETNPYAQLLKRPTL